MSIPTIETLGNILTLLFGLFGAVTTLFWASLVIWSFRDMRLRSRDPFAQILAALLVAAIPLFGILAYLILRPPETLAERYERALEEEALLQEIEERPRCPKCARVVEDPWAMCPSCHTELKKVCADCDHLLELAWTRCPFCTAAQPQERPHLTPTILLKAIRPTAPTVTVHAPQVVAASTLSPDQTYTPAPRELFRPQPDTAAFAEGEQTLNGHMPMVADENPTVATNPILIAEVLSADSLIKKEPDEKGPEAETEEIKEEKQETGRLVAIMPDDA